MAYKRIETYSRHDLLVKSHELIRDARDQKRPVSLVAPHSAWAVDRKLMMQRVCPVGVRVSTFEQWAEELWDLYGEGTRFVNSQQRKIMLRPLVAASGLLDAKPSSKLVAMFAEFACEAIVEREQDRSALSATERRVMEVIDAYAQGLAANGLIECAQALELLIKIPMDIGRVIVERPGQMQPSKERFLEHLGQTCDVIVISQCLSEDGDARVANASRASEPLVELRRCLYAAGAGADAKDAVVAAEARGVHVRGRALANLIARFAGQGIDTSQIGVVFANPQESFPHVQEQLARAGIPFACEFNMIAARTQFGSAFIDLMSTVGKEPDYMSLSSFVATPFSGIGENDARALQVRWRAQGGSNAEARMSDIADGFDQVNATRMQIVERLSPLVDLFADSPSQRVERMFEHAKGSWLGADELLDCKACAEAILDYLSACQELACDPDLDDIGNLPVTLRRSFGDPESAVVLTSATALGATHCDCVIVVDLDSTHYPMARAAAPFDTLRGKLGILAPDQTAAEQRLFLLDALETADKCFGFMRATHDALGDESCQSALWEELMNAYRTKKDEDDEVKIHELPHALRKGAVIVSEAGAFVSADDEEEPSVAVCSHGKLVEDESANLLTHTLSGKREAISPTAIEDYYRCPYRWFACRRIGFYELDARFDASAQGTLVHDAMERFYHDLGAANIKRVTPENLPSALEIASSSFDEQVKASLGNPRKKLVLKTQQDLETVEEVKAQMLALVERDAEFLPGFAPTYFEVELGKGCKTTLEYAGVPVRGKVDRIDVDAQGNAVIVDYKLSSLSKGYGLTGEDELPPRIQTDIYATLVERHFEMLGVHLNVIGSIYRSYSKNALRGVYERGIEWGEQEGAKPDEDALPGPVHTLEYKEYLERVEERVGECMERLRQGDIAVRPIEGKETCAYCKAETFCPRREA